MKYVFEESELCPERTRADLEWDALLLAIAARTETPFGKRLALALPFGESHAASRVLLRESEEACRLARDGHPLPTASLPDVDDAVARAAALGVLSSYELRDLCAVIGAARNLRRFLQARQSELPALFAACSTDPSLDDLEREIAASIDADGTIADRASPELKRLRGEKLAARARMMQKLDDLMTRHEKLIQERFVTEREGRFVLPVRSDAHERFPGIVHGTSGSGATVFVEPRAVIPLGNRLKMLEGDVAREELAIVARLSTSVHGVIESLRAALHALAWADVKAAVGRLALDLELWIPEIADAPMLELHRARHPLLMLAPPAAGVVASDLAAHSGRAVVVSGPNAGGKTVALKTLGLAALMVRAGLPIAAQEGSKVGLFDAVLSDVGDSQSIKTSLSTFSAHVKNLVHILEATHDRALVLLDELAGGTDPREGEALAAGVLDSLCARGGAVVATTHYEGLKMLASGDGRFENASVGFDLSTMSPTFQVTLGVPGSSSALAVARRFGMPSLVVERAERFLSREDKTFDEVVRRLEIERRGLELARADAERKAEEAVAAKRALDEEIEAVRRGDSQLLSRETENLVANVRRAKEELRAVHEKLRARKLDPTAVKEAGRTLDRIASQVAVGGPLEPPREERDARREPVVRGTLKKGMTVYVPRLRFEAEVVEVLADGSVRVAAGPLKLLVTEAELRSAPDRRAARAATQKNDASRSEAKSRAPLEVAVQTSDNTVDVRGMRTSDGVSMAMQFLDRSLNEDRGVVFVIHGHGTGALRDAFRQEVKGHPIVLFSRPGTRDEGGDGVTVVWLG